jgi:oligopeptide transport system substrate-binding protein
MKKVLPVLLLCALFLAGCAAPQATQTAATARPSADFKTVYAGELTTLNYLVTGTTVEQEVAANGIDGLIEYDNLGILKSSLASSWEVSKDGLTWIFRLRKGVKWITWEGKEYAEVVAQDWVDALKYSFNPKNASKTANIAYEALKNGAKYYKGEITDFGQVGVKTSDKYTLQYTLEKPIPYFLTMLSYVSFLPVNGKFLNEVGAKFGTDNKNILYNGAYIMSVFEPQNMRVLVKNEKYWDAGNVHIKKLEYKYNKEASTLAPVLFLRGDISGTGIPTASLDEWMKDPAKKAMVHPATTSFYSYFYAFNFDPKFDAQYEPDNWKIVVNNANFRKSIFYALDRKAAMITAEPYAPERRLSNTITPKTFVTNAGKDYTEMGPLAAIVARDSFNKTQALAFKDKALAELKGKAKFPVKMPMPYRSDLSDWSNRAQVVEQQLEGLLGKDFIDIIPVGYPATNFLGVTRRSGVYAIQECNWGPDYADPETYTDPFFPGGTYNWPEKATGYIEANGKGKYENMVTAAKAEVVDMTKRSNLFAEAEAFLINEAFLIPYAVGGGGYVATKLEPFTYPYAPFGMSELKFKGQIVMDKPMDSAAYDVAYKKWQQDRVAALQKAATSTK